MRLFKSSNYDQMSLSDVNEKKAQFIAEYENLDEASQEIWKFQARSQIKRQPFIKTQIMECL